MGHANPVGGSNPQAPSRVIPFGKYMLLDRIAVGGMAEVYTAKSFGIEGFEKVIAIKRILPTMAEDQDFISMFIDEAKIAGHLTHANIVPIYELGKIGESHYIAMEYVWGKDLLQIMNRFRRMRRHMPPVMAAWIASKMLEGLDYAHRKRDRHGRPMGIIHRDVSPQNALVSYEGQVKLIDFGIAKAASRNTKTQAGVLKGKFGYMSPEQVRGMPIDHRSDIFAASTCLHEMLTGERLFVGESDFSTLEKVRNADVIAPSSMIAEMPADLETIVLKGLAREPDERWQTAGEMQEELQRFIALSRPPFGTSKLNTWMRTAFAPEIAKEKGRLDSFSKVSHPGMSSPMASPQARVPALGSTSPENPASRKPMPPPSRGFPAPADPFDVPPMDELAEIGDEDDMVGESTMISASPFEAALEAGELEELAEQPTQIFFTSDDLEEITDEPGSTAPAGSLGAPQPAHNLRKTMPLSAVVAPQPGPSFPQPGQPQAAQGPTAQPSAEAPSSVEVATPAPQADMFAPAPTGPGHPQRNLPTMEVERPGMLQKEKPRGGGMGKWIALLAAAAVLVIGLTVTAAFVFFPSRDTGTISLRVSPESADARVFVDGRQRGRAPLLLEHVPVGERAIEIRAEGYRPITRSVPVNSGSTAMLEIMMEPEVAGAAVVAAAPPPAPSPAPSPAPAEPVAAEPEPAPVAAAPAPAPTPAPVAREPREAVAAAPTPRRPPAERTTPRPTRPVREAPRRAAPAAPSGASFLTINTMPWARVFVDGRDTGRNTPVRNLRVSPGSHSIGLRTNDGTMHTVPVDVAAGETARIVRQL